MKFCPYCGCELPLANAKFCPECGEKLGAPPQERQDRQDEYEMPAQAVTQPEGEQNFYGRGEEPEAARYIPPVQEEPQYAKAKSAVDRAAVAVQSELEFERLEDDVQYVHIEDYDADESYEDYEREIPKVRAEKVKPQKEPRVKVKGKGIGAVKIIIIVLITAILLGCFAGFAALKINAGKAPQNAVDEFIAAVSAGDTQYMLAHMETGDSGLASAEDAKLMCAAMTENLNLVDFKAHLLAADGDWAGGSDERYSAFSFKQTKDSLFFQKFAVVVSPIEVVVHTAIEDITLYVDDKPVKTSESADGLKLMLPPGAHAIRAVYEEYGSEYELGAADVISFSKTQPSSVSVTEKLASAEIELSGLETNLQVLINGDKTDIKAEGGFIVLNPVFSGMTITVKCDEYTEEFDIGTGSVQEFSVEYIEEQEAKEQEDGAAPGEMTNRELLETLAPRFYSFYLSYLQAINVWDATLIHGVSEQYKSELITKMETYNKGLVFNFNEMIIDRRSMSRETKDGEMYASFNIRAVYNYAEKEKPDTWLAGGNYQIVTMHFDKDIGDWVVAGTAVKDAMNFSDDTFTIKP